MSVFNGFTSEELRILANQYAKDFHEKRRQLVNLVKMYDRQDILSQYSNTEKMKELIDDCETIKANYKKCRDVLLGRGEPYAGLDHMMANHMHNKIDASSRQFIKTVR